jgi:hypothetical protein
MPMNNMLLLACRFGFHYVTLAAYWIHSTLLKMILARGNTSVMLGVVFLPVSPEMAPV